MSGHHRSIGQSRHMSDIYTINREYSIVRTSSVARAPGHGTVRTCDVIIVRADRFAALMRSRSLNFCFIHFSKCLLLLSLLLALKSIKKNVFMLVIIYKYEEKYDLYYTKINRQKCKQQQNPFLFSKIFFKRWLEVLVIKLNIPLLTSEYTWRSLP